MIHPDRDPDRAAWFLGIDLGTTAIAATLCNAVTGAHYPLVWSSESARQPVLAYLPQNSALGELGELVVGDAALEPIAAATAAQQLPPGWVLQNFKPFLNLGVPYRIEQTWQPQIPWSDRDALPLGVTQQAIAALLGSLHPIPAEPLQWRVDDWTEAELRSALEQIGGVGLSCAASSSDAFRFNLREAVLQAGLVPSPDRIFFLESPIAALLTQLPSADWTEPDRTLPDRTLPDRTLPDRHRLRPGATLVIDAGASTTELLLVTLPPDIDRLDQVNPLDRQDLHLRSLGYGGNALDQDIVAQLLHASGSAAVTELLAELKTLLPLPGEPEQPVRHRLQQRLRSSLLGQQLLEAAQQLKRHSPSASALSLPSAIGSIETLDLERRVFAPYVQRLNRELNTLLSQTGIAAEAIVQVILTGGTAKLPTIGQWLRQKLPNARLNWVDRGNPVADGLALLPRYAQVLNSPQHQYGEFFLLREVLQTVPPGQALAIGRILQLLENRGLNTQSCRRVILSLLEQLPAGLLPTQSQGILLTSDSSPATDGATSLFSQQGSQYWMDSEVRDRLWLHFAAILAHSHQTLEEPLSCDLAYTLPQ